MTFPSVISTCSSEGKAPGVESSARMAAAVPVILDNDRRDEGSNDVFKFSFDLLCPLLPVTLDAGFHVVVPSDLMCWWLSRKAATAAKLNVQPSSATV